MKSGTSSSYYLVLLLVKKANADNKKVPLYLYQRITLLIILLPFEGLGAVGRLTVLRIICLFTTGLFAQLQAISIN